VIWDNSWLDQKNLELLRANSRVTWEKSCGTQAKSQVPRESFEEHRPTHGSSAPTRGV